MLFLFSLISYAYLGEDVADVRDARRMSLSDNPAYKVLVSITRHYELREFFGEEDIIFAVRWTGRHHHEFRETMGVYYDLQLTPYCHGRRGIGDDLVLEWTGRGRSIRGRAYVLSLLPPGVSPMDF